MMRFIAVSYWPDRRDAIPDDWEIWKTELSIPETYSQITTAAVAEEWDRNTIVVQDDVRLLSLPKSDAQLVVYGSKGRKANHVCPRAFAASPRVWQLLARRWQPWNGQVCRSWYPVVEAFGEVFEVTTHG